MRRISILLTVVGLVAACSKKADDKATTGSGSATTATKGSDDTKKPDDTKAAAAVDVGVEAGGIAREADEGPAAVITGVSGTVEVKRVGEAEWKAANLEDKLYSGDQVRTQEASSVTVAFADESVAEVAEVTTFGVGSRDGTADPASSAAVLAGLARFSVTPRVAGEGSFRVYTPQGVVLTKGTEYGVGVAASGEARVGVESGKVDIVGLSALDAQPIAVETGNSATLAVGGTVAAPQPWPEDDWGTWRDGVDVKVEAGATIDAIGTALANLETQLSASYADLDATAKDVATFEATASASADKGDTAAYEAALPEGSATIDASFGAAGRVEALTWAYAGDATLANDIYVRHPEVEPRYVIVAPRIDAAILWPKRYEVTATGYLEPLRTQYYVHHPRGRAHAELVGVAVPEFYAKVDPPEVEPAKIRAHVKTAIWIAPELSYKVSARPVYVVAPAADWSVKVKGKIKAAPPRAKVAWYVRPPAMKATIVVGGAMKAKVATKLKFAAPAPRASLRAKWSVPVGMKIKVKAPDVALATKARASVKLDAKGMVIRDHRAAVGGGVKIKGGVDVKAAEDMKGKVEIKDPFAGAKTRINGGVKLGNDAKADVKGKVDAGVKVKIKAPPPPSVDVKVKVKAGAKIKL